MAVTDASFVLVDWGTTSFRLWLVDDEGNVLASSRGREGMLHAAETGFEAALKFHLDRTSAPAGLRTVICGMAGARQGWLEAPYLCAPAGLDSLATQAVRPPSELGDIRILPGMSYSDPVAPSVMRGEETQLLGLAEAADDALVCMPGTHCKWVEIGSGAVKRFSTFMTGELFDVLGQHSILKHALELGSSPAKVDAAFLTAMSRALAEPDLAWAGVFSLRASQLLGASDRADGASSLSGLLIGAEVGAARRLYPAGRDVALVASGPIADLYRTALEQGGFTVRLYDAETATRQGLMTAARQIWQKGNDQ